MANQFWVNSEMSENTSVLPSGKFLPVNFYIHLELTSLLRLRPRCSISWLIGGEVWSFVKRK